MNIQRFFASATKKFLVTGVGRDRKGIARDVTSIIFNEEGNIMNTKITKFQQNFTLSFLVEILDKNLESFKQSISKAQELLAIRLDASEIKEMHSVNEIKASVLIVHEECENINEKVLKYLSDYNFSLVSFEKSQVSAPMGGTELFCLKAKIRVDGERLDELSSVFGKIDDPQIVSVEVMGFS